MGCSRGVRVLAGVIKMIVRFCNKRVIWMRVERGMPKVSEEHLEARKQQIVHAAFLCFSSKGFHPTMMQDICAEAELSAGAVHRYFSSKEAIIASACDESQNATIVRTILVPASMRLLGKRNWYFPSFLEWVPRIGIEGEEEPVAIPIGPSD